MSKVNRASIASSVETRAGGLPGVAEHLPEGPFYASVDCASWGRSLTSASLSAQGVIFF